MFGVWMEEGPSDWQIIQQKNGFAGLTLSGGFTVPKAGLDIGIPRAIPRIRVMNEQDHYAVIPWTDCEFEYTKDQYAGCWRAQLQLPAGGLYRVETGLFTTWENPQFPFKEFRGDMRLHLGVGDLFIIAGQSNAAGCARDSAFDAPDLRVHLYRNRRKWDLACHPMNESTDAADGEANTENGNSGTSPYLSFAKRYSDAAGYPVGLIMTAAGGSPMKRWDPDQKADLYRAMLSKIGECGGEAAAVLWYQGCSDTDTMEQALHYEKSFIRMVQELRKAMGTVIPVFTFQLNRYADGKLDPAWGIVRDVQRRMAKQLPAVKVLPTVQCGMSDGIHNSAGANVHLGEILARQCAAVLLGRGEFEAPDLTGVVRLTENSCRLEFDHVQGQFVLAGEGALPYGFSAEDEQGSIMITGLYAREKALVVELERTPGEQGTLSFCAQADPHRWLPKDGVTYMPPLAFHQVEIGSEREG